MPNRKTDINNNHGVSTDFIGQNYSYPDASYAERARIVDAHRSYQQGLMWTLANHPRVPKKIRDEVSRWGTCRDEFERKDGWQQQLYIREARRMLGSYVMTQGNCQGREEVEDAVGLAAYTMDSHNVQRYVDAQGQARNEGDVQVGGFSPYPISYRSLIPKAEECKNMFVPVALSASHIAFGSIRMEPVFMVLGESAATAACQAIDDSVDVQDIDYAKLRKALLAQHQVLVWTGPRRKPAISINKSTLPGIVVDDDGATKIGFEQFSSTVGPFVGSGYAHDGGAKDGRHSIRFTLPIRKAGRYEIRFAYSANPNRATNVPVTVHTGVQQTTILVNERKEPEHAGLFTTLGTFTAAPTSPPWVEVTNKNVDGYVIADAVQAIEQ